MSLMGLGVALNDRYKEIREEDRADKRAKTAFERQKELIGFRAGVAATQKAKRESAKLRKDVDAFLTTNGMEDTPANRRLAFSAVQSYGLKNANVMLAQGDLNLDPGGIMGTSADNVTDSLIATESSGNPNAYRVNNDGRAFGGRLQFGKARLEDYARSTGISYTPAQFAKLDVADQKKVEDWHFSDYGRRIDEEGLDQYIGLEIDGTNVTRSGMIAAAHIGGFGGLKRFLSSGGRYDPSDQLGTRISKYMRIHGGKKVPGYETPDGFQLNDLGEGTEEPRLSFGLPETDSDRQMAGLGFDAPIGLDMGETEDPVRVVERQPSLKLNTGSDFEFSYTEITRENARALAADAITSGDKEAADSILRYAETLPPEKEDLPSDIDDAALELAQAKDSGDEAAIREAQRNYDTLLRELERRQNAALNRERMAGTGAAPLIEAVVTDPRTNERRIEAVTIDPVSDTYTLRDGTALDRSQVQGLTDQELDLYGKIPSQTITDSRKLRDSATGVIRMLDAGIDAIEIAERNPNALGVRGSAASAATGFVRGASGIVDVASEILQGQDSVTLQELEAELRSEGQLAEGQSLTQMDDQLLNALIPESIQGDARDRAILDSKLVLMAFRSGGLEGQSGNAMSNQDFNRLKDAVATANGDPEVFRTAIGDYIRGTIQAHNAQVQQFSAQGPVGAFYERTGVMPIPVPKTVGDIVAASGNQKLMRSYQTFSKEILQETPQTDQGTSQVPPPQVGDPAQAATEYFNSEKFQSHKTTIQGMESGDQETLLEIISTRSGVPLDLLRQKLLGDN